MSTKTARISETYAQHLERILGGRPPEDLEVYQERVGRWTEERGLKLSQSTLPHDTSHMLVQDMLGYNSLEFKKRFDDDLEDLDPDGLGPGTGEEQAVIIFQAMNGDVISGQKFFEQPTTEEEFMDLVRKNTMNGSRFKSPEEYEDFKGMMKKMWNHPYREDYQKLYQDVKEVRLNELV